MLFSSISIVVFRETWERAGWFLVDGGLYTHVAKPFLRKLDLTFSGFGGVKSLGIIWDIDFQVLARLRYNLLANDWLSPAVSS